MDRIVRRRFHFIAPQHQGYRPVGCKKKLMAFTATSAQPIVLQPCFSTVIVDDTHDATIAQVMQLLVAGRVVAVIDQGGYHNPCAFSDER